MKNKIAFLIVLLLFMTALCAQTDGWRGAGYGYVGGGGALANGDTDGVFEAGGGGEAVLSNGTGFRFELGYLASFDNFSNGLGVFSPGVMQEFSPENDTAFFVGGGYTLFFRSGTGNGIHFGAGARHWFDENLGIRFEVRDEVLLEGEAVHFIMGRVSFLFR